MSMELQAQLNPVHTARLMLRAFREEDVEPLYQIQRDPEAMRYTFLAASKAASAQRLRAYAGLAAQLGFAPWTVILRSEARIIGWGGLNVDPFDPGWGIEVAYFLDSAFWGRGFATELVQASLSHGFGQHTLCEINAYVHRENGASSRVLEKCGFEFHGFEPKLDRNRFVIARKEWLKRNPDFAP